MDNTSITLLVITAFWFVPMFVADDIAIDKNREGWVYGLLLGWLGVFIVWLLPRRPEPLVQ
jgi:hypothetical protein